MRKTIMIAVIAAIICIFGACNCFAAEGEENNLVEVCGTSATPYFMVGDKDAFCIQPQSTHPNNGSVYTINENFEVSQELERVFINGKKLFEEPTEVQLQVMQLAIWQVVDPTVDYRNLAVIFMGEDAGLLFDDLVSSVEDADNYNVKLTVWSTEEKDLSGNNLQTLITGSVIVNPPVINNEPEVIPDEPEVVPDEPEVIPDTPDEPVVPDEPEVVPDTPDEPIVPVMTDEEPLTQAQSVTSSDVPKTGDTNNLTGLIIITICCLISFLIIFLRKRQIRKD